MSRPPSPSPSSSLTAPERRTGTLNLNPSLVLENSGSVARDHLASERTFLAYIRTSLAIAGTGVALVQLFTIASSSEANSTTFTPTSQRVQEYAKPLGAVTIFFALGVLAVGVTRYFSIQKALTEGKYPVARLVIGWITIVLCALVVAVFAVILAGKH